MDPPGGAMDPPRGAMDPPKEPWTLLGAQKLESFSIDSFYIWRDIGKYSFVMWYWRFVMAPKHRSYCIYQPTEHFQSFSLGAEFLVVGTE